MWGRYGRKFNKGSYFKDLDKVGDTDYGIVIFRDIEIGRASCRERV